MEEISAAFDLIYDNIALQKMQLTSIQHQVRELEKRVKKELKMVEKVQKKKIEKQPRKPSGFAKPSKVSNELCNFLQKPIGTELARTEVTKAIIQYIKDNGLQEQGEKTKNKIVPDEKLRQLLGLTTEESHITYFSIQKHMNKHFIQEQIIET